MRKVWIQRHRRAVERAYRVLKHINFVITNPLPSFPQPEHLFQETTGSKDYRVYGRQRPEYDYCVFQYSLRGQGGFRDSAGEHIVNAGQSLLCKANDPAADYYFPRNSKERWTWLCLVFKGQSAEIMVKDLVARYGPVFTFDITFTQVHRLMESMPPFSTSGLSAAEGAGIVNDLLSQCAMAGEAQVQSGLRRDLVRHSLARIKSHPGVTVAALAKELSVSREHLSRLFSQSQGRSLHACIEEERISLARALLKNTNLRVKEVAMKAGYGSMIGFLQAFRRNTGSPPEKFRMKG
jgi:AraC-like DNA-binding protein